MLRKHRTSQNVTKNNSKKCIDEQNINLYYHYVVEIYSFLQKIYRAELWSRQKYKFAGMLKIP